MAEVKECKDCIHHKKRYCRRYTNCYDDPKRCHDARRWDCDNGIKGFEKRPPKRPFWQFFKRR